MAVKTFYTCDGCDKLQGGDPAYVGTPAGWVSRYCAIRDGKSAACWLDKVFDLCDACAQHQANIVDPTKWPRAEKRSDQPILDPR